MVDRIEALKLDSVVVPIDDHDSLVPVDTWLASLRDGGPLTGAVPAADLVAQARQGQ